MKSSRSPYHVSAVEPDQHDSRHGLNSSIMEEVVYQKMSSAASMPVLQEHTTNEFDYLGPVYYPESFSSTDKQDMTGLFQLIAKAAGMNFVGYCFNSTVLKNGVEASVNGILAQWAHDNLFSNTIETNDATLSYIEDRLRIRQLSQWLMFAGFLVMACLSVVPISWRPRSAIPLSPASITGMANILAWDARLHRVAEASPSFERHQQKEQSNNGIGHLFPISHLQPCLSAFRSS